MIIVAGHLVVDPADRAAYLEGCLDVIRAARTADGCVDFHLSADPLEPGRINIFEQWTSAAAVEQFRGADPGTGQQTAILEARVDQHEVSATTSLT